MATVELALPERMYTYVLALVLRHTFLALAFWPGFLASICNFKLPVNNCKCSAIVDRCKSCREDCLQLSPSTSTQSKRAQDCPNKAVMTLSALQAGGRFPLLPAARLPLKTGLTHLRTVAKAPCSHFVQTKRCRAVQVTSGIGQV